MYKRGFVKVNKQRIPITNNKIIEDNIGNTGCVCIEDVVSFSPSLLISFLFFF